MAIRFGAGVRIGVGAPSPISIGMGVGGRTVLLTAQSNSFVDNSPNGLTITNRTGYGGYGGSVVTSTQNPFS